MINKQSTKSLAVTQARQNAWFKALNRCDFFTSQFQHSRVCDLHFISGNSFCIILTTIVDSNVTFMVGKSAKYSDVNNPDWVPTLNLGYQRKEPDVTVDEATSNEENEKLATVETVHVAMDETWNEEYERQGTVEKASNVESIEIDPLNDESVQVTSKQTQTFIAATTLGTQTDGTITGMSTELVISYKEKIKFLEDMLVS